MKTKPYGPYRDITLYMPIHSLVGSVPLSPHWESILAYLHHLHKFYLINSKSKLGVLQRQRENWLEHDDGTQLTNFDGL